jgi:hypothetical protein
MEMGGDIMSIVVETNDEINKIITDQLCKNFAEILLSDPEFRKEIGLDN